MSELQEQEVCFVADIHQVASWPVGDRKALSSQLQHWYQAFPGHNYIQACEIGGSPAIVCTRQLSVTAPVAYQALLAICKQHGIHLKEDARSGDRSVGKNRRKMAVVLSFCLSMVTTAQAVGRDQRHDMSAGIDPLSSGVSLVCKNQTLADVAHTISRLSGIVFKFNAAVENDRINTTLAANSWQDALPQLLQGYNYSTIQERKSVKTVFITGYQGGEKPQADEVVIAQAEDDRAFEQRQGVPVVIPAAALAALPEGGSMEVDLPLGSFSVSQASMVTMEDGTLSWVGTMDDASEFYRLYLAQTQNGDVIGNVFAPQGTYNIETVDGQTVMLVVE